jgi:predicted phage terminase large subunit-like protein
MQQTSTLPPSLRLWHLWPDADKKAWLNRHNEAPNVPAFYDWLHLVTPGWSWDWEHLSYVREYLEGITRGDIEKLMLFLPPRHGKSEMVTIRYASWFLEKSPQKRVIIGAYNQTLANKFSRKARRISRDRIAISTERTAVEDWETEAGGGLRAIGVGGGITGQGGDLIIIDDPVKNREEANSLTYRNKVWDWYTDDLYTRREPNAKMILIMTRWHEDDLAGRILASDDGPNWTVISLPAIAEDGDDMDRELGAPLCPERYDLDALHDIKTAIGSRSFAALFQQRPVEQEGDIFKRSWFKFADASPADAQWVRYWDKGASTDGDPTVGVKMGRSPDGLYYVADVVRGQWTTNERDRVIRQTAELDGGEVAIYLEQEPGSSGVDSVNYLIRQLAGYAVRADKVTGSKQVRAEPFAAQMEAGNVYLIRGRWNNEYIDELCTFPNGTHDDQVDGSSGSFAQLADVGELVFW